jgi:hypothetical protein
LTEVGKKQIDAAVVVEVARGHAHTAVTRHDAARLSDIGERKFSIREIVPEQSALTLVLDQKDIEVAVVVHVERRGARADDFGVVELTGHAVDVREAQAGVFSAIGEPVGRCLWTKGRRAITGRQQDETQKAGQAGWAQRAGEAGKAGEQEHRTILARPSVCPLRPSCPSCLSCLRDRG